MSAAYRASHTPLSVRSEQLRDPPLVSFAKPEHRGLFSIVASVSRAGWLK
jgi:hypothetical protein